MKSYTAFKVSGIDWIDVIPAHWKVRRLKDIGKICLGKMLKDKPDNGYYRKPYLKSKNIGWLNLNLSNVEEMYFNEQEMATLRLKKGDLILSEGGEVGKTSIWNDELEECYIQNSAHKISFNNCCDSRFYLYLSYYLGHIGYYKSIVNLVSIMHLTYEKLRRVMVPVPPLDEQERLAAYLDKKCGEIDGQVELLEKKRKAYERLKTSVINNAVTRGLNPDVPMRDSGIDWIGEIPAHWNRLRLKDVSFMYSGLTGKSGDDFRCDDDSKTKPFVPFTNVLNNTRIDFSQFNRVVMNENESQNRVGENDLIFLMSSEDYESIAKSAVVIGDPGEVYLNSFCRGLRFTSDNVFAPFVNYQLNASKYRDSLRFEARGFTRINIKIDRIASQFITIPPIDEQRAIATYLDEKCGEIDAAIENIGKQIDAYKRLKRSLINEVVTGKRAV